MPVKFKIYKFRFAFSNPLPWGFMVWKIIKFTIGVEIGKTHTVQYSVHSLRCISFCAKLHTYLLCTSGLVTPYSFCRKQTQKIPLNLSHAIMPCFHKIFFQVICNFIQNILWQIIRWITCSVCAILHQIVLKISKNPRGIGSPGSSLQTVQLCVLANEYFY